LLLLLLLLLLLKSEFQCAVVARLGLAPSSVLGFW